MRAAVIIAVLVLVVVASNAAPQSKLRTLDAGSSPQFVDEVVVESILNVRRPDQARSSARQGRTNTQVSLADGSRIVQH